LIELTPTSTVTSIDVERFVPSVVVAVNVTVPQPAGVYSPLDDILIIDGSEEVYCKRFSVAFSGKISTLNLSLIPMNP
jgi:hypothetical protein